MSVHMTVDHTLDVTEQRARIAAGKLRELRHVAPHISRAAGTVIRKALNLDPATSFGSALAFGNALTNAARNTRDWRRVTHADHVHCLEGNAAPNRAAVTICTIPNPTGYLIEARLAQSQRRVANIHDTTVTAGQLPRTLQQLVKKVD
jgi:serine/threonine-protein kinase